MNAQADAAYFHALYADADPFGYRDRWYEQRKRALLLASLPAPRYARGWEIGCSNGETTAALAGRCDALLSTDLSARAVALARARVSDMPHVTVEQAGHPAQWPEGRFDLIVFSEVGYYLTPAALAAMARRLPDALGDAGVLVACHWRAPFDEAAQTGDAVHEALDALPVLSRVYRYRDADFVLEAWSRQRASVAQQSGLR